jgi:YidC/Oxa1 family membrane protein insertase
VNPWQLILQAVFGALRGLEGLVGDWGVAIILLTIVFRVALMPLTVKQTKSMYQMQKIQPRLKEIQAKYKDDKEKQSEELMKFYAENKVNPLGGCLPALLQMPLFVALYQTLGTVGKGKPGLMLQYLNGLAPGLRTEAVRFLVFLPDITKTPKVVFADGGFLGALPYLVFVVLFGVSIWLPQQLMPGDQQQKTIGMTMAVMFLYFGWVTPAGVLLYWVTSSAIGIAQQQIQLRMLKHADTAEAAAAAEAKRALKTKTQGDQTADESDEPKAPRRKKKK